MTDLNIINESKYIKPAREIKVFRGISIAFIFVIFVMPQYFGIPLPVFDLSALRIMIIIVSLLIFSDRRRSSDFIDLIKTSAFFYFTLPYLFVITYTMILRADLNAFLNPFIEIYTLFLLVYVIRASLGTKNTIKLIILFAYLLTILGIVEYVVGKSPFSYLETIKGLYTGQFVRSGNYRIMSCSGHSLGYGLILVTVIPFWAYDEDNETINLNKRPILLILFLLNVLLTGSRSTLGVVLLEVVLMVIIAGQGKRLKFVGCSVAFIILFSLIVAVFHNTSFGRYVLLQFTSLIDTMFNTSYSVQYGADLSGLRGSSVYRERLNDIFKLKWLNPVLGIGRRRSFSVTINGAIINSIDNFYIGQYVMYAYTGMFSYMLFLGYWLFDCLRYSYRNLKGSLSKVILVASACYMLNLKWVDALLTLKYLYLILAIQFCYVCENKNVERTNISKYIKKSYL